MFSTLSFHASSQASPSLIKVKSTNPRVFFKHVFLMSVLLWGKFHLNPPLRYTQAKHSLPGNRVLEVSLDLWPEIIPDWESSFFFRKARAHEWHLARLSSNNYLLPIPWETFPLFVCLWHCKRTEQRAALSLFFPPPPKAPDIWSRPPDAFVRTFANVH